MQKLFVCLVVLFGIANCSFYFKLEEGAQRCFIEEVPKDTLVVGHYVAEEYISP